MLRKDQENKIRAAYRLLTQEEISFKTFEDARALVKGINPRVDKALESCSKAGKKVKKVQRGDVVGLTEEGVKALPEDTEKRKKRKKALLLFFKSWRDLRSVVKKTLRTFEAGEGEDIAPKEQVSTLGKMLTVAKGPLGLLTGLAIGIGALLAYLNASAVAIVIKNQGCDPITPSVSLPVPIPGLELPTQIIPDGGSAVAKIPPLKFTVDGSQPGIIQLAALRFTMNFQLKGEGIDLLFNGKSLIGRRSIINLGDYSQHVLVINCAEGLSGDGS